MNSLTAAEQAGITYRQMDHWIRRGYIAASCPGSGHEREITERQAAIAKHMGELTKAGMKPAAAAQYARDLVNGHQPQLGPYRLVKEAS